MDHITNPILSIDDLYEDKSNTQVYDLLVFIGRFQPFHLGHSRVIDIALRKANKVLVLVGSSDRPRRPRNPWNYYERAGMIINTYNEVPASKLIVQPLLDYTYRDSEWIKAVQELVSTQVSNIDNPRIGLIGCAKDHSSYYLNLFPQWGSVNVRFLNPLNSTDLRKEIFSDKTTKEVIDTISPFVPLATIPFLRSWRDNYDAHIEVKEYWDFCAKYKEKRQLNAKYPVQDITADNIVTCSGHVLLVRRKKQPGKGLWALPGGYINPEETLQEAALRELREETKISLSDKLLKAYIKTSRVFDDPHRSERGRIITNTIWIDLPAGPLPKVKGSDDAEDAKWVPLSDISSLNMFEDHFDQIQAIL